MNWLWICVTALLAAAAIGFGVFSNRNPMTNAATELPPQPAYYLKDAIVTETQDSGEPGLRLIAERIEQQPPDNSYKLESVRADYLKVSDKVWHLTAQRGHVPANSRIIQLMGDVRIDGPESALLRTDEISIDTEQNLAYTTTSPTTILFSGLTMRVKRLEADLNTGKVKTESVNAHSNAN